MIAGAAIVLGAGRWLDALSLGEDTARSLGADTGALGLRLTLGVGLMVGAATSVAGVIGFVGLVAPHLVRARVGFRPGATMVPSMLVGAVLVLAADILVRAAADRLRIAARRLHLAGRRAVPGARDPPVARGVARRHERARRARAGLPARRPHGARAASTSPSRRASSRPSSAPTARARRRCLRHLAGLDAAAGAQIELDGRPIAGFGVAERARRIAYLPQGASAYWPLLGRDLVALGRLPHGADLGRPFATGDADAIGRALARVDGVALADRPIDALSRASGRA